MREPAQSEGGRRLELWVTVDPETTDRCVDPVVDRLDRLDEANVIDGYEIRTWGHRLDWSSRNGEHPDREAIRERVEAAVAWARREGVAVPFPAPVPAGYGRMGPEYTEVDLPEALLVELRDGEVVHATPHWSRTESTSIDDHLATLEALADLRERSERRERAGERAARAERAGRSGRAERDRSDREPFERGGRGRWDHERRRRDRRARTDADRRRTGRRVRRHG